MASTSLTLDQLISLGEGHETDPPLTLKMDIRRIVNPLKKLQAMVGMSTVKETIVGHVLFFLQGMHEGSDDMLHTVIQGPPGVGKTMLGGVLAEIYHELGIIKKSSMPSVQQKQDSESDSDEEKGCGGGLQPGLFILLARGGGIRGGRRNQDPLAVRGPSTKRRDSRKRYYKTETETEPESSDDEGDEDEEGEEDEGELDSDDPSETNSRTDSQMTENLAPKTPPPPPPPPPPPAPKPPPFRIVRRSDLIGKYLGHTAALTQRVINSCLGGVMFIDEAYSLGNAEGRDSFSKECIDTINQNLSEKKGELLVIIAGYKDDLDTCFFAHNPGLHRRFPFVYSIEPYSPDELVEILCRKVNDLGLGWQLPGDERPAVVRLFERHHAQGTFTNHAGDVETLLFTARVEHAKRVFCKKESEKKVLRLSDIDRALKILAESKAQKGDCIRQTTNHMTMYT
jgi:hypothetical protein